MKIAPEKVAIYIRWSTEDQGQGHTLEIQRESCRYYCLSQGWQPSEALTFIDEGCSGGNLERPALGRLRAEVQAGRVQCVVVYKLDRLSRNIKDIINLVLDEWEDRCSVRSTQEPVDTTSDAGRMFFTMLGSFADFERSAIRTRTWSGKRKSAEKGRNPGMLYPYGYQKGEDGGWAVVASEAATVRQIYRSYIRGHSCRQIAAELNRAGQRTRAGGLWANGDISRLLRNPLYIGRLVYNRRAHAQKRKLGFVPEKPAEEIITAEDAAPAIIDRETWEQAEQIRLARPRVDRGASARTQSSPYLLAGLLRCSCGHAWIGVQGGKQNEQYYACAGARTKGAAQCASRLVKAALLDQFVRDRIAQTWPLKPAFQPGLLSQSAQDLHAQQEARQKRLAHLQQEAQRFKRDYKAGRLSPELYSELAAENRREQVQLSATQVAAPGDTPDAALRTGTEALYQALDPWAHLTLTEQQQILRLLIEQIQLSRPKGARDAEIHIQWRIPVSPAAA